MSGRLAASFLAARGSRSSLLSVRPWITQHQSRWYPQPKDYDSQFGDYPRLPWSSIDQRNPYARYDDPVNRRNFGETLHEEFDIQDAYFIGEHDPWKNLWLGLRGQAIVVGIFMTFFGAAWLTLNERHKMPARELPEDVLHYLKTAGWDRVKPRPYEPLSILNPISFLTPENAPLAKEEHAAH